MHVSEKRGSRGLAGPPSWMGSLVDGGRDPSGQMYMRNRFYDPTTGRFTQEDPIGLAGGINLYGFAGGDAVNFSDPYGLCPDGPDPCPDYTLIRRDVERFMGAVVSVGRWVRDTWRIADADAQANGGWNVQLRQAMGSMPMSAAGGMGARVGTAARPPLPQISRQQQNSHVTGTPGYINRVKQGKSTSAFPDVETADNLTLQAWERGRPLPGRPNVREHDFERPVSTPGPNGGHQTRVRVHQNQKGCVHGHPSGPEC
jgi:RHS repeat-associated protein